MRHLLFVVALATSVGCASENTSTQRTRLSVATKDCQRVEQVCLETFPPQCFDVCLDPGGGGGSTECETPPGAATPAADGTSDRVICGGDECIAAPIGGTEPGGPRGGVACTEEAKLCPDGETYVGRTGPYCDFAACPGETQPPIHELPPDTEVIICPPSGGTGGGTGTGSPGEAPACTVSVDSAGRETFSCPSE